MKAPCASCLLLAASVALAEPPENLRCEWQVNPTVVQDPCPEFYWEAASQSSFRVVVAASRDALDKPLWDSGQVRSPLPIVEYAGPRLKDKTTYFWRVQVWDAAGKAGEPSEAQQFTTALRPMPHVLPSVRTFINFGGSPEFAKSRIDLCFRRDAKQGRADILATKYSLVCTLVVPSEKADALAKFCVSRGLTKEGILEDMFCHFAEDTHVTLHVGAERAGNPREKRLCPGWDPANDRNRDGRVDDAEAANLANPKATARQMKQARVPIYYWGPPRDDFVMNVGHPAYQEFMATVHAPAEAEGYDGLYFDTVPPDVAGPGRGSRVLEYPRVGDGRDKWLRDLQMMFAKMKLNMPGRIITGNGWDANPMVMDGAQHENWLNISWQVSRWRRAIEDAVERDRRGKIQLVQYNPIFHPELSEFGAKFDVDYDRDKLFGLASYLMAHGGFTYFGFGSHPYQHVEKQWFKAIEHDLGEPKGPYAVFAEGTSGKADAKNLLANGDFEAADGQGNPADWTAAEPVELDAKVKRSGKFSAKIASADPQINNINKQYVKLKPRTTYTLIAWLKTENVVGSPGAQVYPHEFDGMSGGGQMITVTGTSDWKEYRHVFTTAEDAEGRINFRIFGATGTAWFDDVQLVEGAAIRWQVFSREFTKGLVLVKPNVGGPTGDETATAHKLPGAFRPLRADGSLGDVASEAKLRNAEAAIFAR